MHIASETVVSACCAIKLKNSHNTTEVLENSVCRMRMFNQCLVPDLLSLFCMSRARREKRSLVELASCDYTIKSWVKTQLGDSLGKDL